MPQSTTPLITYYALDLEKQELMRTLNQLATSDVGRILDGKVDLKGLCATYHEGLKLAEEGGLEHRNAPDVMTSAPFERYRFAEMDRESSPSLSSTMTSTSDTETTCPSTPDVSRPPLHILFLGSTLGNFSRADGATFLRSLPLTPGSDDTLLIGLDHDNSREKIEKAYNDPSGYTRKFIMNGLKAAGRYLGDETMFPEDRWEYINFYNEEKRMSIALKSMFLNNLPALKADMRHIISLSVTRQCMTARVTKWLLFWQMSWSISRYLTK